MRQYLDTLEEILSKGSCRDDRTGTGAFSVFGPQLTFDLVESFPIITTKQINFHSVVRELLWMLRGSTNVKDLHPCKIWDPWADQNGDLGPVYGHQWRKWGDHRWGAITEHDQIASLISSLKNTPLSRRQIVSAWNVAEIAQMKLPPCHLLFQAYVDFDDDGPRWLDMKVYQRSADWFLGVPFNISQYALLTHIIGKLVGLTPRKLIMTFGDAHVYMNHTEQATLQLKRLPHEPKAQLVLPEAEELVDIDAYANWNPMAFKLKDYSYHPAIRAPISV